MRSPATSRPTALLAVFTCLGCTGSVRHDGDSPSPDTMEQPEPRAPGIGAGGAPASPNGPQPTSPLLPPRLWRLTHEQYRDSVRSLLGVTIDAAATFPADPPDPERFGDEAARLAVAPVLFEGYVAAAEDAADKAVAKLATLLPCAPANAADTDCVRRFAAAFARRAWRRPLTDAELAELAKLYDEVRAGEGDAVEGIKAIVQVVLLSPRFFFRSEVGIPLVNGTRRLTSFELVTLLSYALQGTTPPDEWLGLAQDGSLDRAGGPEALVRRALAEPQVRRHLARFFPAWMHTTDVAALDKDAKRFPLWSPELMADLDREQEALWEAGLPPGEGNVESLLRADFTFANARTAPLYGITGIAGGELRKVSLRGRPRLGPLTGVPFLAAHAGFDRPAVVERGVFVRKRMLCEALPPPPPNVAQLPEGGGATARERLERHATNPSCAACHKFIDPLGLALEAYDAMGQHRTMDEGRPIDPSGTFASVEAPSVSWPFRDAVDLLGRVLDGEQVYDCIAARFIEHALGVSLGDGARTATADVAQAFRSARYQWDELVTAVLTSPRLVLDRKPPEAP